MKKILCLLLVLALSAAIGCGSKEEKKAETVPTGEQTASSVPTAEPTEAPTPEPTEEPTPVPTSVPTSTPSVIVTPEPTQQSVSSDLIFGTISGSVWESELIGLGCRFDGWRYSTPEEISYIYNYSSSMFSGDLGDFMRNNPQTITMMASSADQLQNVNITLQDSSIIYGNYFTPDELIDASLDSIGDVLASAGYTNLNVRKSYYTFLGAQTPCIDIEGSLYGFNIRQVCVYHGFGQYNAFITATSMYGGTPEDLLANFYALD